MRCCLGTVLTASSDHLLELKPVMAYVAWRVSTAGGPWFRAAEEGREVAAQQTRYWRLGGWSYSSSIPKSYYCENGTKNIGKEAIYEENKSPIFILSCNFCM